jgi:tripartite-type tricarboxylate transporter receptor subunit TctC
MNRVLKTAALGLTLATVVTVPSKAESDYPTRPIRMIVGTGAGGLADLFIRKVGNEIQKRWGRPLVVENRTGAEGHIAAAGCSNAPPDGYTICMLSAANFQFDRAGKPTSNYGLLNDLEPVTQLFHITNALVVSAKLNASTLQELAAYAKANPKSLSYTIAAPPQYVLLDEWIREANVNIVRIPFRGGSDAVTNVLSGNVPMAMLGLANVVPYLRDGTMKGILITASTRSSLFPDIPTATEVRPQTPISSTDFSLFAPKGTSLTILRKIRDELVAIAKEGDFEQKNFTDQGLVAVLNTPQQFSALLDKHRAAVELGANRGKPH